MSTDIALVIVAVTAAGIALGAGRASAGSIPFDAIGSGGGAVAAPNVLVAPRACLGEIDLSLLGVPESELASIGPTGATADPPADGPNTLIVDDDRAAAGRAFTSIRPPLTRRGRATDKVPGHVNQEQCGSAPVRTACRSSRRSRSQRSSRRPADDAADSIAWWTGAADVTDPAIHDQRAVRIFGCAELLDRHYGRADLQRVGDAVRQPYHPDRDVNPALFGCQDGIGVLVGRDSNPGRDGHHSAPTRSTSTRRAAS